MVLVVQALNNIFCNILQKLYSLINAELILHRLISSAGIKKRNAALHHGTENVGQYRDSGHEKCQNHISSQWERAVYHRGSLCLIKTHQPTPKVFTWERDQQKNIPGHPGQTEAQPLWMFTTTVPGAGQHLMDIINIT